MKKIDFSPAKNGLIKVSHQKRLSGLLSTALLFAVIGILLITGIVFAQPPLPTKPVSEATGVNPSNIEFSWSASDPLSDTYTIDISKKSDMSSPVTKTVASGLLGFTYNGTLEDNTSYYWRVSGGGQTSPVLKFTTKAAAPTTTSPSEKSFTDGIIETLGWPVIIGIFCVLFVLIVLILAFRKPRGKGQGQIQGQNQSRRPPPVQNQCPSCGFLNPSNRQSCISCGGVLPLSIGVNQMGGQQGMRAPGNPMGHMGGGMGAVNPPYQMGTGPTNFQNPMGGTGQMNTQYPFGQMGGMGANMQQQQQPWQAPQMQQRSQQNTVCPSCGTPATPGKQFCGNCGASLISPQLPQQVSQFQDQQQTQQNVICPACGSPNPVGRPFCGNCGSSLAGSHQKQIVQTTQSFACPVCGNQINAGMNPCPSCNTWLEWGP